MKKTYAPQKVLCIVLGLSIGIGLISCKAASIHTGDADARDDIDRMEIPAEGRFIEAAFDVSVERDIPYGQATDYLGQEQTLLLDVLSPKGDTRDKRPAILWIHGGDFVMGSKESSIVRDLAEAFTQKGYVCIPINYRLRAERQSDWAGTLTDAVTDAKAALAWTVSHSEEYGIDPARIACCGYSAGAIISTGLAYNKQIGLTNKARKSLFGIVNIAGGAHGLDLIGGASGQVNVGPDAPDCLIIHGTEDDTVPYDGALLCAQALDAAGIENTLYTRNDGTHDFQSCLAELEKVIEEFLYKALIGSGYDTAA